MILPCKDSKSYRINDSPYVTSLPFPCKHRDTIHDIRADCFEEENKMLADRYMPGDIVFIIQNKNEPKIEEIEKLETDEHFLLYSERLIGKAKKIKYGFFENEIIEFIPFVECGKRRFYDFSTDKNIIQDGAVYTFRRHQPNKDTKPNVFSGQVQKNFQIIFKI
jgi:hypothetical protein